MKIFSVLLLATISLCAGLCCNSEEDEWLKYQYLEIKNNNLISIENDKNSFQLHDTIYVNTSISNNQITVDNEDILLTDYIDLDYDSNLYYSLVLYKETDFGTLAKIAITNNNIIVLNGLVENIYDEIIDVKSDYDDLNFTSEFGIKLLESGTYYLASPNFDYTKAVYISGNSTIVNSQLTIISKIRNSDENGAYKFTVE